MEGPQESLGGCGTAGAVPHLKPSALLDQMPIQQQTHRVGAVHTPDLIHISPCGGLVVGNDGQHLQRRLTQLGGLAHLKGPADDVAVFRRGAKLIAVLHLQKPHAPALVSIVVRQLLQHQLHRGAIHVHGHADAIHRHRLAGGKKDALDGRLNFLHFKRIHILPPSNIALPVIRHIAAALHGAVVDAGGQTDDAAAAQFQHRHKGRHDLAAAAAAPGTAAKSG